MLKRLLNLFLILFLFSRTLLCAPPTPSCISFTKLLENPEKQIHISDPIFSNTQQIALRNYQRLSQKHIKLQNKRTKQVQKQGPEVSRTEMQLFGKQFDESAREVLRTFSFPHTVERRAHGYRITLEPNSATELGRWVLQTAKKSKLKVVWNSSYTMLSRIQGALYDPNSSTLSISPGALAQFSKRGNGLLSLLSPSSKELHEGVHRTTDLAYKRASPLFLSGDLYYPKDPRLTPYQESTGLDEITAHLTEVATDLSPLVNFLKTNQNLTRRTVLRKLKIVVRETPILDGRSRFKRQILFESLKKKLEALFFEFKIMESAPKLLETSKDDGWFYLTHPASTSQFNLTLQTENEHSLQLIQAELPRKEGAIMLQWFRNSPKLETMMNRRGSQIELSKILLQDLRQMKDLSAQTTETYTQAVDLQNKLRRILRQGKIEASEINTLRRMIIQNYEELIGLGGL